jgi:hypothetical protein
MSRLEQVRIKRQEDSKINSKIYFKSLSYPKIDYSIDDIYVTTTTGDRLDLLADQFYNDVDLWWIIAIANPDIIRRDSLSLKGGLDIRIPTNHHLIVQHFNAINK